MRSAGERAWRRRTIGGLQSLQLSVREVSFIPRASGADVDAGSMRFAFLEVAFEPRTVFPCIEAFAVDHAFDEVADIGCGAPGLAFPVCQLGSFVAVAVVFAAEISFADPATVSHPGRPEG